MFLSKNLSDYIIILHMSCRNSLTNRYTKQTFGKRLTSNMLSIGIIIQKNHQCDIPSSSKASALVLASFDHSCIKVDRVGTFSFMHTEVFSSAKKDDMKLELVSKELNHFGVIADLFRQIGGHSSRFVLFCSF